MVSDTKIIRHNSVSAGQITAYPPLGTPQVSSPPKTAEYSSHDTGTDLVDISTEGRQAQAQLDIENLLQNIQQKNSTELSPQDKKLLSNPSLANRLTLDKGQPQPTVAGDSTSSYPVINNKTGVKGALSAIGTNSQIVTPLNSFQIQSVEPRTLQAEQGLGFEGSSSLQKASLTAQTESMAVRAQAELQPKTATRGDLNGTPQRQVIYPMNTSANEPLWVNLFA